MCEKKQDTNTTNIKPTLNTTPLGSDVIYETFAQKHSSNTQTRDKNSSKKD